MSNDIIALFVLLGSGVIAAGAFLLLRRRPEQSGEVAPDLSYDEAVARAAQRIEERRLANQYANGVAGVTADGSGGYSPPAGGADGGAAAP